MTKATLKKNIHEAIDNINDEVVLQAVYTLLNRVSSDDYEWTDEDIRIVAQRRASYLSGKDKGTTVRQTKRRLRKKLNK